jgi:hypothetical protein
MRLAEVLVVARGMHLCVRGIGLRPRFVVSADGAGVVGHAAATATHAQ